MRAKAGISRLVVLFLILVLPVSAMAFMVGDVDIDIINGLKAIDAVPLPNGDGKITYKYNDEIQTAQLIVFMCNMCGQLHIKEVRYIKDNKLQVYRSDGYTPIFTKITDLTDKEVMEITIELNSYLNPI